MIGKGSATTATVPSFKRRETMKREERVKLKKKAVWMAEAFGIVLAYFGAFGLLMYPVLDAAGYLA
jgi:hypothetical protein